MCAVCVTARGLGGSSRDIGRSSISQMRGLSWRAPPFSAAHRRAGEQLPVAHRSVALSPTRCRLSESLPITLSLLLPMTGQPMPAAYLMGVTLEDFSVSSSLPTSRHGVYYKRFLCLGGRM